VLADVAMTRQAAAARASYVEFNGFPGAANALAYLSGVDAGTPDLQTTTAAAFNSVNVSLLPGFTVYNATAADADRNGNARIDNAPDEYAELRTESASLRRIYSVNENSARGIVDVLYQILRNTSGVTVTFTRKKILGISYTVATLNSAPTAAGDPAERSGKRRLRRTNDEHEDVHRWRGAQPFEHRERRGGVDGGPMAHRHRSHEGRLEVDGLDVSGVPSRGAGGGRGDAFGPGHGVQESRPQVEA
jgi:hypothetical protein